MSTLLSAIALAAASPAAAPTPAAAPAPTEAPAPKKECCCAKMDKPMACCAEHKPDKGEADQGSHGGHDMNH